jgi:VIT1/CCC1 family predicted Fe2+/Mn2+ transporter
MFATALGVSDGILNALTLASARVLGGVGLDLELGVRVGVVAFSSAVVTLFVAEYAQNRLELVRAERQLMFTRSGRLAATHLGRAVLRDAAVVAGVAGLSSFAGAALPLAVGAVLPKATWIALVVSVAVLGALGIVLSLQVGGRRPVWAGSLVLAGIAVTIIGVQVDLV